MYALCYKLKVLEVGDQHRTIFHKIREKKTGISFEVNERKRDEKETNSKFNSNTNGIAAYFLFFFT